MWDVPDWERDSWFTLGSGLEDEDENQESDDVGFEQTDSEVWVSLQDRSSEELFEMGYDSFEIEVIHSGHYYESDDGTIIPF